MKVLILGVFSTLLMCEPKIVHQKQQQKMSVDTISTVVLSKDTVAAHNNVVVIKVFSNKVQVESFDLNTEYTIDADNVYIKVNEQGGIERLSVDNTVLFGKQGANHTYQYLDDNSIIVQKGNTISGIVTDHLRMGYDISKKSLYECNPRLKQRGLQVGDTILLYCN